MCAPVVPFANRCTIAASTMLCAEACTPVSRKCFPARLLSVWHIAPISGCFAHCSCSPCICMCVRYRVCSLSRMFGYAVCSLCVCLLCVFSLSRMFGFAVYSRARIFAARIFGYAVCSLSRMFGYAVFSLRVFLAMPYFRCRVYSASPYFRCAYACFALRTILRHVSTSVRPLS